MTTTRSTPKIVAGNAGLHPAAGEKTAPPQSDRAAKPIRRVLSKAFRPRVVDDAPPPAPPAVILWDDPVDPAGSSEPKG